jgi:hypothetical protein
VPLPVMTIARVCAMQSCSPWVSKLYSTKL